jgi:hypothetical protein
VIAEPLVAAPALAIAPVESTSAEPAALEETVREVRRGRGLVATVVKPTDVEVNFSEVRIAASLHELDVAAPATAVSVAGGVSRRPAAEPLAAVATPREQMVAARLAVAGASQFAMAANSLAGRSRRTPNYSDLTPREIDNFSALGIGISARIR